MLQLLTKEVWAALRSLIFPDPMRYARADNATPWAKQRKAAASQRGVQLNVRTVPGTEVVVRDTEIQTSAGRIIETEVVTPQSQGRMAILTDADKAALRVAGLAEVKATLLKPYWAKGMSSRDASNLIRRSGKPNGYSERTIDAFWAVFSKAMETEAEKGEVKPYPLSIEW